MTKYISGERIKTLMSLMGRTEYSGRHRLAPQLQGDSASVIFLTDALADNDEYHLCPRGVWRMTLHYPADELASLEGMPSSPWL